jgi:hypothetical protein
MAAHPNDPRDCFGEVQKRNELRREARLPLLDLEAETARLRRLDLGAAYANFFAHLMVPHNVKWDRPPTSWSESMGRMGPQRRAEERMKPEVDRKWARLGSHSLTRLPQRRSSRSSWSWLFWGRQAGRSRVQEPPGEAQNSSS